MKYILTFTLVMLFSFSSYAQHHFECQFKPSEASKADNLQSGRMPDNGDLLRLRVAFHQFREDDGTGGFTDSEINDQILVHLNQLYAGMNIQFESCGIDHIDDSDAFNALANFNTPERAPYYSETNVNSRPDVIDLFPELVTFGPEPRGLGRAGGTRAFATLNVVSNSVGGTNTGGANSGGATTTTRTIPLWGVSALAHEVGHLLGLFHTHEVAFGAEMITRGANANCTTAGDFLCDTEAALVFTSEYTDGQTCEFLLGANTTYISSILGVTVNHPTDFVDISQLNATQLDVYDEWLRSWTIEDGVYVPYDQPVTNIMGYGQRNCRIEFTEEQKNRARARVLDPNSNISRCRITDFGTPQNESSINPGVVIVSGETIEFSSFQLASGVTYLFHNCTVLFNGDVVIPAGAHLKFEQSEVQMDQGTFFVEQTGRLSGDRSTFGPSEKQCLQNYTWGGIRSEGAANPNTIPCVTLFDCTLHDAECAVHLGTDSQTPGVASYPSSLFVMQSVFVDNDRDIFLDGETSPGGNEPVFPGVFYNIFSSQFTDSKTREPAPMPYSMRTIGVNNVFVVNSSFSTSADVQLLATNTGLELLGYDIPNAPYSFFDGTKSDKLIEVIGSSPQELKIRGYSFSNEECVYIAEVPNVLFENNIVNYGGDVLQGSIAGFGLKLVNGLHFDITGNTFLSRRGQGDGCLINNGSQQTNHIRNNEFLNTSASSPSNTAIRVVNVNRSQNGSTGLQIACNAFVKNYNAVVVEGAALNSGIAQTQGSLSEPANNTFEANTGGEFSNLTSNLVRYVETSGLPSALNSNATSNVVILYSPNQGQCSSVASRVPEQVVRSSVEAPSSIISPNPSSGRVTVTSDSEIRAITFLTNRGRVVLSQKQVNGIYHTADLSGIESGIYFIRIEYASGFTETKRVVKL